MVYLNILRNSIKKPAINLKQNCSNYVRTLVSISLIFISCISPPANSQSKPNHLIFEVSTIPWEDSPAPVSSSQRTDGSYLVPQPEAENSQSNSGFQTAQNLAITEYLESIEQWKANNDRYSPAYQEDLTALGLLYQQQGNHELAIDYFDQAQFISRMNNGLFSLNQVAIIKNMISSLIATGRLGEADQKQQYLLMINQETYGPNDIRIVPAVTTLGDWNYETFVEIINLGRQPTFSITSNAQSSGITVTQYNGVTHIRNDSRNSLNRAFFRLFQAQNNYYQAINTIIHNREYLHPELQELEKKLISTYYLQAHRLGILQDTEFFNSITLTTTGSHIKRRVSQSFAYKLSYKDGRDSYSRIMLYLHNDPQTTLQELVNTKLALADWHLMFGHRSQAVKNYQEIHDFMKEVEISNTTIDALMSPPIPVSLPTFFAQPHSREKYDIGENEDIQYRGYIDVTYQINRYGKAKYIKVLDRTSAATNFIEGRLKKVLRESQFRLRFINDEPVIRDSVSLRYYFSYS